MAEANYDKTIMVVEDMFSAINAVFRIVATAIIYIFHCGAHYNLVTDRSLFYAFTLFLFISGYYASPQGASPHKWLLKRLKKIYIPYWIVIVGVIATNEYFKYKSVSLTEIFFLVIGGNLFIEHKLYVIAWFVSAIILFYLYVYFTHVFTSVAARIPITILIFGTLYQFGIPVYFFVSFAVGYGLKFVFRRTGLSGHPMLLPEKFGMFFMRIYKPLMRVQNYSYYFFLLHGGVVLLFAKVLQTGFTTALLGGTALTALASIPLKSISDRIERRLPI